MNVTVTDSKGRPIPDTVVSLAPSVGSVASHVQQRSVIDQQHETFLPLVVVVRKGGEVVFTNNDTTMHQVYSFSPVKQFQFEIDQGQVSKPVAFDKPGVAAIGCNIHDNMVAYVFVADAPYAAVTDASGHAEFRDVADGTWQANVWHPQLRIGRRPPPVPVVVANGQGAFKAVLPLGPTQPSMSRMHKDY